MPQLPDRPDLAQLRRQARELIDGQYADRPQLRPVGVLAVDQLTGVGGEQARRPRLVAVGKLGHDTSLQRSRGPRS